MKRLVVFMFVVFACAFNAVASDVPAVDSATSISPQQKPEWDGVYLKDLNGSYVELKEIQNVRFNSSPDGTLYYNTKDYLVINPDKFKGFFVKGKDLLSKPLTFQPLKRYEEMSFGALFGSSKPKYQDIFALSPRVGYFELRNRQEGDDARYYEPTKSAVQFFGDASKGNFVLIKTSNKKQYIFGIGHSGE